MTPTPSALSPAFLHSLCEEYKKYNQIDAALYNNNNVKRGLRNSDGTGVVAGLTNIGNVHGYIIDEGDIVPVPGKLYYRGIDLEQLVDGFLREDRFGFEETSYLLLFGHLPKRSLPCSKIHWQKCVISPNFSPRIRSCVHRLPIS